MKSITIKTIFATLILIAIFTSCQKDEEGFVPNPDPTEIESFFISDIFGVVTNRADEPIEGAVITFKGTTTTTDEDGIYRFDDVQVGSQHNTIKIEKEGYFENARTFRTATSGTLYQKSILQNKNFSYSFQSSENGLAENDRVSLAFPANSVVIESTGELYDGEVQLAMNYMDPTLFRLEEFMPGDLTAIEDDNSLSTLESFGMVNVEMQTPSGEKLQIGTDQSVEMSYRVSSEFLSDAPATIDMWFFDFDLGVWVKEGQAILNGDTYTGQVSHFSTWNYDISAPSVVVSGQVLTDSGDLAFFQVSLLNADNKGGHGSTDDDGRFSGRVEAGVPLTFKIFTYDNCFQVLYEETVGPFSSDTDLGTITVEIDPGEFINITGTAVDCDLDLVEKGSARIENRSYPIVNGEINLVAPICNVSSVDLRLVDAINLRETIISDIQVPGNYDLGQVEICGDEVNFFGIDNLTNGPINLVDSLSFYTFTNPNINEIIAQIWASDLDVNNRIDAYIQFTIGEATSMDELEEKTYPMTGGDWTYQNIAFYSTGNNPTDSYVVIESIIINQNGEKEVKGNYNANCIDEITGVPKILTGSFKMIQQ